MASDSLGKSTGTCKVCGKKHTLAPWKPRNLCDNCWLEGKDIKKKQYENHIKNQVNNDILKRLGL